MTSEQHPHLANVTQQCQTQGFYIPMQQHGTHKGSLRVGERQLQPLQALRRHCCSKAHWNGELGAKRIFLCTQVAHLLHTGCMRLVDCRWNFTSSHPSSSARGICKAFSSISKLERARQELREVASWVNISRRRHGQDVRMNEDMTSGLTYKSQQQRPHPASMLREAE